MGVPKKPTALKEIQGTAHRNKQRQNPDEPVPTRGIGPAPVHFGEAHQKIWDEVVGVMYAGVLGEADRIALEIMVMLIHRLRWADGEVYQPLNGAELARLTGLLSQFGMTPADRTKIAVPKTKKSNPFEGM